jgi:hypothetical protein
MLKKETKMLTWMINMTSKITSTYFFHTSIRVMTDLKEKCITVFC